MNKLEPWHQGYLSPPRMISLWTVFISDTSIIYQFAICIFVFISFAFPPVTLLEPDHNPSAYPLYWGGKWGQRVSVCPHHWSSTREAGVGTQVLDCEGVLFCYCAIDASSARRNTWLLWTGPDAGRGANNHKNSWQTVGTGCRTTMP